MVIYCSELLWFFIICAQTKHQLLSLHSILIYFDLPFLHFSALVNTYESCCACLWRYNYYLSWYCLSLYKNSKNSSSIWFQNTFLCNPELLWLFVERYLIYLRWADTRQRNGKETSILTTASKSRCYIREYMVLPWQLPIMRRDPKSPC
jgi:hypothetical protein